MITGTTQQVSRNLTPTRHAGFDKRLLGGLLGPHNDHGDMYLGSNRPARRQVLMFLLPKPWTYLPISMEHMTRLDVYKRSGEEPLRIFVPKPGWGYQVVEMAEFTRLEIFRRV